jgi:hypothetical protein
MKDLIDCDSTDYTEHVEPLLPLPLVELLVENLEFHLFYPIFARLSSQGGDVFLRKHKPQPHLFVGQTVNVCKNGEMETDIHDEIAEFTIVQLYEEGRCAKIIDDTDTILLVDGRNIIPTDTYDISHRFVKCDGWILLEIDGELDAVSIEYSVKSTQSPSIGIGRIAGGQYIPNSEFPKKQFDSMAKALRWKQTLYSIKPGDIVQTTNRVKTKVVNVQPGEKDMSILPYWAKLPPHNKPLTAYSVSKTLHFKDIEAVATLKESPCYESNGIVYQPGKYIVLMMDGYPVFKVKSVTSYGIRIRYRGVNIYIHEFPHSIQFDTRQEAATWKYKKCMELEKKQALLRPGDMVLLWSSHPKQKKTYQYVRNLDDMCDKSVSMMDTTEYEEFDSMKMYCDLKRVFTMDWEEVPRLSIRDISITTDLPSIQIGGKTVCVGWWVTAKVKILYEKVQIQRIVNNGIVFDNRFHFADTVKILHIYLSNPILLETGKRKDVRIDKDNKVTKRAKNHY